jgi:CMP-N-acetylneuraminic acid synthetase
MNSTPARFSTLAIAASVVMSPAYLPVSMLVIVLRWRRVASASRTVQFSAQALACPRTTRVVVSTDNDEIAAVAAAQGAEVPFRRRPDLAQDLSPDIGVFSHAIGWLSEHEGHECELIVHLRPTGPVRKVEVITTAIDLMLAHPEADSLRSVTCPIQTP